MSTTLLIQAALHGVQRLPDMTPQELQAQLVDLKRSMRNLAHIFNLTSADFSRLAGAVELIENCQAVA